MWDAIESDLTNILGVDPVDLRSSLRLMLLVAALLHDIGKANSAFQAMLHPNPAGLMRQPARHEILSAIVMTDSSLMGKRMSELLGDDNLWVLAWAVGGHHLQLRECNDKDKEDPLYRTANTPAKVTLHFHDEQITQLVDEVEQALSSPSGRMSVQAGDREPLKEMLLSTLEDDPDGLEPLVRRLVRESKKVWRRKMRDRPSLVRLALLKALLISADVAASALAANRESPKHWIPRALTNRLTPADLDPIVQDGLKGKDARPFQTRIAESRYPATVVMAGCGSGKTTAAYMWAKRWANGKKLFFAYPTTGTASAGFEDYLLAQTGLARALIHGRAWVDLQRMLSSPEDDEGEESIRLESLMAWNQQVIACTVDTVLGLVQNQRRPLFSLPAIACGAFVFDEIHSYDDRLFRELLIFLRTFPGAPVLLMSASIPPKRLSSLREVLGERMGSAEDGVIRGDSTRESILRYQIHTRSSEGSCWGEVLEAMRPGSVRNKVLWVCNTVRGAQEAFREAKRRGIKDDYLILYHSRIRYRDRVERQERLLKAFARNQSEPCLAITTQVCEMSLDISADLLVTAMAPLPALVQRLGRLNRYADRDDPWPCLIFPFAGKPYDRADDLQQMEAARRMIEEMGERPYSQAALASFLAKQEGGSPGSVDMYSAWLDGGWQSESLPAREADTSLTVILEKDIPKILATPGMSDPEKWNSRKLVPWTVPILAKGFRSDRRAGPYPIAPLDRVIYDEIEGIQ